LSGKNVMFSPGNVALACQTFTVSAVTKLILVNFKSACVMQIRSGYSFMCVNMLRMLVELYA